jgi:hypothetical protein
MNKIENHEYLYHYNQLILSWINKAPNEDELKLIARIFKRVLDIFPSGEDRETLLSALKLFPLDLAERVFSDSQLRSKKWLTDILQECCVNSLGNVYILGGWCGLTNRFLRSGDKFNIKNVYSLDLDTSIQKLGDTLNSKEFKQRTYKSIIKDVRDLNYLEDSLELHDNLEKTTYCDSIINTSCEHMDESWINSAPTGVLVIAQSNNDKSVPEHEYCSDNLNHFKKRLDLDRVIYSGELELSSYKRFMVIGYK